MNKTCTFSLFQVDRNGYARLVATASSHGGWLAPFFDGMSTTENVVGEIYYRTVSENMDILNRASNAVAGPGFVATFVVIITWHKLTTPGGNNDTPVSSLLC